MYLTILAVVEVDDRFAARSDDDLLDDAKVWLSDLGGVQFLSVQRGVSIAAQNAGAAQEDGARKAREAMAVARVLLAGSELGSKIEAVAPADKMIQDCTWEAISKYMPKKIHDGECDDECCQAFCECWCHTEAGS